MSTNDIGLGKMGFSEEAKSITREVTNHMYVVTNRVRKGHAALKMLRFWLNERDTRQGATSEDLSDVQDLVDMALEALPHHYEDINDPVDDMTMRACKAIDSSQRWQERTEIALKALTVATWPDVSVGELDRLAKELAVVADTDESLVEAWEAFKRLLAPRGLEVAVERAENGALMGVSVLNAAVKAEYQRLRRACGARAAAEYRFEKAMEASHVE